MWPVLWATAALAGEPQWWLFNRLGVAYNPLGAIDDFRAEVRAPLPWEQPGSLLLDGTYVGGGLGLEVSPAYLRVGPRFSVQPVAFFDVTGQARLLYYFGVFDDLMGFDDLDVDYDDAARATHSEDAYPALGLDVDLRPELKIKVGHFFAVDQWEFHYYRLPGTEPYVFEPYIHLLMARQDVTFTHDAVVGAFVWDPPDRREFIVAAISENTHAVATRDHSWSVGPLVAFSVSNRFAVPKFAVLSRIYIRDQTLTIPSVYVAIAAEWEVGLPMR